MVERKKRSRSSIHCALSYPLVILHRASLFSCLCHIIHNASRQFHQLLAERFILSQFTSWFRDSWWTDVLACLCGRGSRVNRRNSPIELGLLDGVEKVRHGKAQDGVWLMNVFSALSSLYKDNLAGCILMPPQNAHLDDTGMRGINQQIRVLRPDMLGQISSMQDVGQLGPSILSLRT